MDKDQNFQESSTDDDACKDALEKYELLNDEQDDLFLNIDNDSGPSDSSIFTCTIQKMARIKKTN